MIESSETLKKNGDIYIVDTFIFKTRNLLKMGIGEDIYNENIGVNYDNGILNYNINDFVINSYFSQYLGRNKIYPNSIDIDSTAKGILNITVEESYQFLNVVNGEVVLGKKLTRSIGDKKVKRIKK